MITSESTSLKRMLVSLTLLAGCACSGQPANMSPYDAPIVLRLNQRVETREPERLVCQASAALVCMPVLAARVPNALWNCVCLR
jgi:hypothetical protein